MIYLLFALLASTGIIITFRLFENHKVNILRAIGINYVIAAGYGYLSLAGTFSFASLPGKAWFPFALIIGIIFIIGFNLFALSVRYAGVAVTAISSRMSVVIPVTFGFVLFHDPAPVLKIAGIIIALSSFYFIFAKSDNQVSAGKYLYLPLLLFMVNGTGDLLMKFSQQYHIGEEFVLFLSTVFLTSLILAIVMMTFKLGQGGWRFEKKDLIGGVALGLLNWWSTICFLRGLKAFDVSWFVPLYNVGVVVISALIGYFVFKEQLRFKNWIGVMMAILAILLIALS
jgi:drug/metabolite transporter (DMT)-like permease